MRGTPLENRIESIVEPVVSDLGFRLVCVEISGQGGGQVVQIMAEDPETRRLNVDACAKISRAVSAVMDVEDPIKSAYRLEVSSPGIDRPLVRIEDFNDFAGHDVKVELDTPLDGQKRFRGILAGERNGQVLLKTEDKGEIALPFGSIGKAKIVMTDALLAAAAAARKKS